MKRVFLAVDISYPDKVMLNQWRESYCSNSYKKVQQDNFHLTLIFIGLINEQTEQGIIKTIDKHFTCLNNSTSINLQQHKNLQLKMNTLAIFVKPQVLYLGTEITPTWLEGLQRKLYSYLFTSLDQQESNPEYQFIPHITLFRKAKTVSPVKKFPAAIKVKTFSLYYSNSAESGVKYIAIKSWKIA